MAWYKVEMSGQAVQTLMVWADSREDVPRVMREDGAEFISVTMPEPDRVRISDWKEDVDGRIGEKLLPPE